MKIAQVISLTLVAGLIAGSAMAGQGQAYSESENITFKQSDHRALFEQASDSDIWTAWGQSAAIEFDMGVLDGLGIEVTANARKLNQVNDHASFAASRTGEAQFVALGQKFVGFQNGTLAFKGDLELTYAGQSLDLSNFRLAPTGTEPAFYLLDSDGTPIMLIDHIHYEFDPAKGILLLFNTDMTLTPEFAKRFGNSAVAGMYVGSMTLELAFALPPGVQLKDLKGGVNCTNPRYNLDQDVALTGIFVTQRGAVTNNQVAIAPSATLQNVGDGEVPWIRAFNPPGAPYNTDQHPFLVWAMYSIDDGIPRMLGQSDVKHAFNAVNTDCSCQGGDILWAASHPDNTAGVGCSDTYGATTNDNPEWLGPRGELHSFSGVWDRCGSHFDDTPSDCLRSHPPPSDVADHRMWIDEADLASTAAEYHFEAWYLVRDDINIFNTMGRINVNPTDNGGSWSFPPLQAMVQGPAIDEFVPVGLGLNEQSVRVTTAEGHLTLAMRAEDLGGGQWRYVYALMNHDFDPGFSEFSLPLDNEIVISDVQFFDIDNNASNDWSNSHTANELTWQAPGGNELLWGTMFTFVFTAEQQPAQSSVDIAVHNDGDISQVSVDILGVQRSDVIFIDEFEGGSRKPVVPNPDSWN